jgi:predicted transposase YdaD
VRYDNWYGVIIFPSRSLEASNYLIHDVLVDSYKVQKIYLDELGDLENQPLGIGLMLLTTTPEDKAIEAAKFLLRKTKNTEVDIFEQEAIIDLVTKITEVLNVKILRILSNLCIGISDTKFEQLMTLFSIENRFYLGKTPRL